MMNADEGTDSPSPAAAAAAQLEASSLEDASSPVQKPMVAATVPPVVAAVPPPNQPSATTSTQEEGLLLGANHSANSVSGILEITVSDPVKQGDSINAYMSYKINTKTDQPQFQHPEFTVVRRYRDFVWLRSQLVRRYPGLIVPPLPEKMMMGRFSDSFVESRRKSLQQFLVRVSQHPTLRNSDDFKLFLESGDGFSQEKEKNKAKKTSSPSGFWKWATQSIQQKLTSSVQRQRTEDDIAFDEVAKYIDTLEQQMTNVHKHTQGLIAHGKDAAKGLFEFGLAFSLLGQCESDNLAAGLGRLGHCADKLSTLSYEEAEKEFSHFEEPIKDYLRIVAAVRGALNDRNQAMARYESALQQLAAKKVVVQSLSQQGKEEQVATAQQEVINAQKLVDETKEMSELITSRVLQEVERFKAEKLVDFKHIILDYVQLQIEYNAKVAEAWRSVLPDIESIDVTPNNSIG